MEADKIKVGITQGDINGISYEVIIKTLMDNRIHDFFTTICYGSPKVAAYHRKALQIDNFSFNNIKTSAEANSKRPNMINCLDDDIRVELGKSTETAGKASVKCLETAVQDLKSGAIDVLVTGPADKSNIQSGTFQFKGHTGYFESVFTPGIGALMLMVSNTMRVGMVTGHVPLADVPGLLSEEVILNKLRVMHASLKVDFGFTRPNIAVLGLNPHGGDSGLLGKEEMEIIGPAIQKAREEGIMALGPFASDGFYGSGSQGRFDGILAMYHDQGLIPFKTLNFMEGVNFTAGLPVIRTAPVHGTAYEIAGKNQASPDSFRNAIYLAADIHKRRIAHQELSSNPLEHHNLNDDNG